MKTIKIKGKEYIEVHERIKHFRKEHKNSSIETEILSHDAGVCVMKACIFVDKELVATGHAYEKEGSSFINKTSYIENCETSAIGRALGIFGIGIETSIASVEEIRNAEKNQKFIPMTKKQSEALIDFCKKQKLEPFEIAKEYTITKKMSSTDFEIAFRLIKDHVKSGDLGYKFAIPEGDEDELFEGNEDT